MYIDLWSSISYVFICCTCRFTLKAELDGWLYIYDFGTIFSNFATLWNEPNWLDAFLLTQTCLSGKSVESGSSTVAALRVTPLGRRISKHVWSNLKRSCIVYKHPQARLQAAFELADSEYHTLEKREIWQPSHSTYLLHKRKGCYVSDMFVLCHIWQIGPRSEDCENASRVCGWT